MIEAEVVEILPLFLTLPRFPSPSSETQNLSPDETLEEGGEDADDATTPLSLLQRTRRPPSLVFSILGGLGIHPFWRHRRHLHQYRGGQHRDPPNHRRPANLSLSFIFHFFSILINLSLGFIFHLDLKLVFSLALPLCVWKEEMKPYMAKFESRVLFDTIVRAYLSYGGLIGLEGLSQEVLFLRFPAKDIIVDDLSSCLILFDIGVAHKQFSLSFFEDPPVLLFVAPKWLDGGNWGIRDGNPSFIIPESKLDHQH